MDKLRIFGVPWHTGNQHEMLKITRKYPVKFSWLLNNVRKWTKNSARPEPATIYGPDQFEWVDHYEPGKYDLAILHIDQQCADPAIGKGQLYRQLNEVIQDIPKLVINHGTPMWDEMYTEDVVINGGKFTDRKGNEREIDGIKKLVGDNFMVVNSYKAVERWGWGYPLIHGMDPDEWWDLPKEPRPVIQLSPGGLDKYYNRQLLSAVKAHTEERVGMKLIQITVDWHADDWDDYRNFLGRSLLYINPTRDSAMPRSRTEAMLSGCCVLTSRYHDADKFIEHGVNGFIVPDNPLSYSEAIYQLVNHNYQEAVAIGQKGRETALKYFHIDRYLDDIWKLVSAVAKGERPAWDGQMIFEQSKEAVSDKA